MDFIGMILAGDGIVEASILFETRTEAEDKMHRLLIDHFDPTFDRVIVDLIQTYDDVVEELVKAREEK